ncbi:MAG: DNA polymerase I, partial [Candidatus Doudnabacteria bacterium CG10_big_fil_rev_8_21_14_0_10_41_10]
MASGMTGKDMFSKSKKLMIVDGNSLVHRGFHAIPHLSTSKGEPSNGVYGFVMIFLNAIKQIKPDYVAVAFDVSGPTFRHKMFSDYKAKRVKAPQELYDQIPKVKEFVKSLNLPIFEKQGYEADDVIGTIVKHKEGGVKNIIVTGDLDALQLVNDHTSVFTTKKGLTETIEYDEAEVKNRYGFGPEYVIDYKALRGDPSDNIPGVIGIGEKGACELIKKFGHIEDLYKALENPSTSSANKAASLPEKLRHKLIDQKKEALLSKKLATIDTKSPVGFDIEKTLFGNYNAATALKFLQEMEFKSLLDKLPRIQNQESGIMNQEGKPINKNYHLIKTQKKLDALIAELKKQKGFAVDTETTSQKEIEAELLGVAVCYQTGEAYYIPVSKQKVLGSLNLDISGLKRVLLDNNIEKYGHNIKYDYAVLNLAGIDLQPLSFDTMIAAYLLNPGARGLSLDNLTFTHFGYQMQPIEDLIGKGKNQITLIDVPVEKVAQYSCEDADFTLQLKEKLESQIIKEKLAKVFYEIDMPLIPVLALMEKAGVKLDTGYLSRFSKIVGKDLESLEKRIHKIGGGDFNIASPKQLKEILFTKLQISTADIKKTKTGLSTAASELEKMKDKHPIISLILEYRE